MASKRKKVVTIGGGSGQYVLLSGLRDLSGIDITAVVSMADSGGSTGRLRDELGILPPGDVLKCTIALSPYREVAREILQKKLSGSGRLEGHIAGNMFLTILSQYAGSFPEGVTALGEVLNIKGRVLPVTTDKATLVAELADGKYLYGENAIDVPERGRRAKIKRTFLVPHHAGQIRVYPPVIKAFNSADYIIIGPGDLYTSITPNFLVAGVSEAIKNAKAKIIFIVNIMTKCGETDGFTGRDFIDKLEAFIGREVDVAIFNSRRPEFKKVNQYKKQRAEYIRFDAAENYGKRMIIKKDLLIRSGSLIRHDNARLAAAIKTIL